MVTPDDDAVYLYIANRMASGDLLYRDVWDHKLPFIYFWTYLFGASPVGSLLLLRAATLSVFTAAPFFVFVALRELTESQLAAFLSAVALILWFVPSREMNAVFLELGFGTAAALLLITLLGHGPRMVSPASTIGYFLTGVLLALSFAIRPLTAPVVGAFALVAIVLRSDFLTAVTRLLFVAAGFICTISLVLLPFIISDTVSDMVKLAWDYNRSYVGQRSVLTSIAKLEQFVREIFDVRLYNLTFLGLGSIGGLVFSMLRLMGMAQDRTARESQSFLFGLAAVWLE
jgi:hypothetical protein